MKLTAVVDSVELCESDGTGDRYAANLLLQTEDGERPLGVFALTQLPEDTKAGDVLTFEFTKDTEATERKRKNAERLQELLKNRRQQ